MLAVCFAYRIVIIVKSVHHNSTKQSPTTLIVIYWKFMHLQIGNTYL